MQNKFWYTIKLSVISCEIIILATLYPPPHPVTEKCFIGLRSQWSPGEVCSCLRYLRHFLLCQSKNMGGGYNADRVLISRDIAKFSPFLINNIIVHQKLFCIWTTPSISFLTLMYVYNLKFVE